MTVARLTTGSGAPLGENEHSLGAGERGPLLLHGYQMVDKLAHFVRERIPERVVHARGAGALGYFEATADISASTRADLFGATGPRCLVGRLTLTPDSKADPKQPATVELRGEDLDPRS